MRSFLLFSCLFIFGSPLYAQSFTVFSSYPEYNAVNVQGDSLQFTFSEPVVYEPDQHPFESGFYFEIVPYGAFEIDSAALSDDELTVTLYGTYESETDFAAYLTGATSVSGKELSKPHVFQFTTAAESGDYTISGTLSPAMLEKITSEPKSEYAVILSYTGPVAPNYSPYFKDVKNKPLFKSDLNDDFETGPVALKINLTDSLTGEYVINGIREGEYYPLGYSLFDVRDGMASNYEDFNPDTYIYDPDENQLPNTIELNASTAPNDTLYDINLTVWELAPITFKTALNQFEEYFSETGDTETEIFGGYAFGGEYEDYDGESWKIKSKDQQTDNILSGKSLTWVMYGYHSVKDSVGHYMLTPSGIDLIGYYAEDEFGENVEFDSVKSLPPIYIDSDSASTIMMQNGLTGFLESARSAFESENSDFGWDFEVQLLHEYWEFTPDTTPTAPVFWSGDLEVYSYDYISDNYRNVTFEIYLDAETGAVLFKDQSPIPTGEYFTVVDVFPADGSTAVDTDSIVITFDSSIYIEDEEDIYDFLYLEPMDSVNITGISQNLDGTELTVYIELADETDYVGFIANIFDTNGNTLESPFIFHFTTAVNSGPYTITGEISLDENEELPDLNNMVVMLTNVPPEIRADFDDEENNDEDALIPVKAANINPDDGSFEITGVREGNYYPIAFNFYVTDGIFDGESEFSPAVFFYDADDDFIPDSIIVNDETTDESGIYADLILRQFSVPQTTFKDAVEIAKDYLEEMDISANIIGGGAEYNIYEFEDLPFKTRLPYRKSETSKAKMMNGDYPNGYSYVWQMYAFQPEVDSLMFLVISPADAYITDVISADDIEDPVDFSVIKFLPDVIIDSDSAAKIIETEGGSDFRLGLYDKHDDNYGFLWWDFELEALHEYWEYPPDSSPDAPYTWIGRYYANYGDPILESIVEDSITIYLDVSTGELLHSTAVSIDSESELPQQTMLGQNYPNPFNPNTSIPFTITSFGNVEITVYNLLGQKVATITDQPYQAGNYTINFDASGLSSGMYIYRLKTKNSVLTKKLLLVK